jgi:hypothetical protein
MKHVTERPFADPQAAARKLIELAASIEPVQDGRIHIEKINYPFVSTLKGSGPEFGAGIRCAIEKGWLKCPRLQDKDQAMPLRVGFQLKAIFLVLLPL